MLCVLGHLHPPTTVIRIGSRATCSSSSSSSPYNNSLLPQGYVWFLPLWYTKDWYKNSDFTGCTTEEMMEALEGHMSLSYQYFGPDDNVMQENVSIAYWRQRYMNVSRV